MAWSNKDWALFLVGAPIVFLVGKKVVEKRFSGENLLRDWSNDEEVVGDAEWEKKIEEYY